MRSARGRRPSSRRQIRRASAWIGASRALPQWISAQRPSKKVVPINNAVRPIAVKFLADNPARQLLVVLLDDHQA